VERRLASTVRAPDPADELLALEPAKLADWLVARAVLADGSHPTLPLADPESALRRLRAWGTNGDRLHQPHSAMESETWRMLEVGLLRGLAGATFAEVARLIPCSMSTACVLHRRHRASLVADPGYAARVAAVTAQVVGAALGGSSSARSRMRHPEQSSLAPPRAPPR
jgi:hypothetical protein